MNRVVFKYQFPLTDETFVNVPVGAEIIHIDQQGTEMRSLTAWAIVDPTVEEMEARPLYVRGTGYEFSGQEGRHLATVLVMEGALVWHVFEAAKS